MKKIKVLLVDNDCEDASLVRESTGGQVELIHEIETAVDLMVEIQNRLECIGLKSTV